MTWFVVTFILTMIGCCLAYVCYTVIAAISNLIMGPLLGYEILQITFYGLTFIKENEKFKFRLTNLKFTPEVLLLAKPAAYWKKIILELIPLAICVAAWAAVYLNTRSFSRGAYHYIRGIFLIYLLFLCIRHLIICVRMIIHMYGKGEESVLWREQDRVNSLLNEGLHPKDITFQCEMPEKYCFGENRFYHVASFHRYYKALEMEDWDAVERFIPRIAANIEATWSANQTPYFYELIYYYSAIKRDISRVESYAPHIIEVLRKDKDINGRRVYAAYLYYTGKDKNLALQVAKDGLEVVEQYPCKGIAYMERDILSKMIQETEDNML